MIVAAVVEVVAKVGQIALEVAQPPSPCLPPALLTLSKPEERSSRNSSRILLVDVVTKVAVVVAPGAGEVAV